MIDSCPQNALSQAFLDYGLELSVNIHHSVRNYFPFMAIFGRLFLVYIDENIQIKTEVVSVTKLRYGQRTWGAGATID
jgi:hypothetical protein